MDHLSVDFLRSTGTGMLLTRVYGVTEPCTITDGDGDVYLMEPGDRLLWVQRGELDAEVIDRMLDYAELKFHHEWAQYYRFGRELDPTLTDFDVRVVGRKEIIDNKFPW